MRFVERAVTRPGRCAAIPFIHGNHPKGFIDTGTDLPGFDNHVYVSVEAVEQMARMVGWVPQEDAHEATARAEAAEARIAELEQELAEAEKQFQAIDVIESAGFRARKKPGRPPKKVEEMV